MLTFASNGAQIRFYVDGELVETVQAGSPKFYGLLRELSAAGTEHSSRKK